MHSSAFISDQRENNYHPLSSSNLAFQVSFPGSWSASSAISMRTPVKLTYHRKLKLRKAGTHGHCTDSQSMMSYYSHKWSLPTAGCRCLGWHRNLLGRWCLVLRWNSKERSEAKTKNWDQQKINNIPGFVIPCTKEVKETKHCFPFHGHATEIQDT